MYNSGLIDQVNRILREVLFLEITVLMTFSLLAASEIGSLYYLGELVYLPALPLVIICLGNSVLLCIKSFTFLAALRVAVWREDAKHILPCDVGELMLHAGCEQKHVTLDLLNLRTSLYETIRLALFFSKRDKREQLSSALNQLCEKHENESVRS